MKIGTFLNLMALVVVLVIGAILWLLPTWLFVSGYLLLITGLAVYAHRNRGLWRALGQFFKDLLFGW